MNYITDMLILAVLALVIIILASLLRYYKTRILTAISSVVQQVEQAIEGSKMGAEKKKLAKAQLEVMGIRVTKWVDEMIDVTVEILNVEGAWLIDKLRGEEADDE